MICLRFWNPEIRDLPSGSFQEGLVSRLPNFCNLPANFIAETTAMELPVLGSEVALPAANKTYYRVWRWTPRASGADHPTMPSRPAR